MVIQTSCVSCSWCRSTPSLVSHHISSGYVFPSSLLLCASKTHQDHSTALLLIRDGYESTVLTSFFFLLLAYLSPDPDDQKAIFRIVGISQRADREARKAGREIKGWVFPLGWVKKKPMDGLYFLQMMKWGVLQYCVIRPTCVHLPRFVWAPSDAWCRTTLAAVILNYIGWYCESSWSPRWGYVYVRSFFQFVDID